jgi:hypothetical protein
VLAGAAGGLGGARGKRLCEGAVPLRRRLLPSANVLSCGPARCARRECTGPEEGRAGSAAARLGGQRAGRGRQARRGRKDIVADSAAAAGALRYGDRVTAVEKRGCLALAKEVKPAWALPSPQCCLPKHSSGSQGPACCRLAYSQAGRRGLARWRRRVQASGL